MNNGEFPHETVISLKMAVFYLFCCIVYNLKTICLQKINKIFLKKAKKDLHFAHIYSIIVMRRGGKAHESV